MVDEVLEILIGMGFTVQYSPEIEQEYYNYGGLNYPPDHPARDMQDTFYITDDILLPFTHHIDPAAHDGEQAAAADSYLCSGQVLSQ